MNSEQDTTTLPKGLMAIVIFSIVIGIFIRFYDLDGKFFWGDEVNTLLYTAGFTKAELTNDILGKEIEVGYLQKYIFTNPDKGIFDVVKSISIEETQHTPLYYVLSSIWMKIFGDSIWIVRSFSVLMGLLVLPGVYWLSRELFESKKVAWIAVSILALSPFHLIYAQEARLYSMWTLITILSSAVLLRALATRSKLWWVLYGLSLLVGIYTFTLFALVMAAHGAYVLLIYIREIKFKPIHIPGNLISYVVSSLFVVILFLPWAYILINNLFQTQSNLYWTKFDIGTLELIKLWGFNLSSPFLDIGLVPRINFPYELPLKSIEFLDSPHLDYLLGSYPFFSTIYFILKTLLVVLILYSIYFVMRFAKKRISIFLLVIIIIPFIAITFKDLISGGIGSTIVGYRFFMPVILGTQLTLAFLLASNINKRAWQVLTIIILLMGLASCITYFKADTWWTLRYGYHVKRIAPLINNADDALVITKNESQILAFPHHLNPEVKLLTVENIDNIDLSRHKGEIFVYDLQADQLAEQNKLKGYTIEEVNSDDKLWRLNKN